MQVLSDVGVYLIGAGVIGALSTYVTVRVINVHIGYLKEHSKKMDSRVGKIEAHLFLRRGGDT